MFVTSTVVPLYIVMMSSGRYAFELTMFSAAGNSATTCSGSFACAIACIAPNTAAPPHLSYFMPFMPLFTLSE